MHTLRFICICVFVSRTTSNAVQRRLMAVCDIEPQVSRQLVLKVSIFWRFFKALELMPCVNVLCRRDNNRGGPKWALSHCATLTLGWTRNYFPLLRQGGCGNGHLGWGSQWNLFWGLFADIICGKGNGHPSCHQEQGWFGRRWGPSCSKMSSQRVSSRLCRGFAHPPARKNVIGLVFHQAAPLHCSSRNSREI